MIVRAIGEFFFENFWGKVVAGVMLGTGLISWFAYDQRQRGAANVITEINSSAHELADSASAERRAAERPGALDRLRHHSCRDC